MNFQKMISAPVGLHSPYIAEPHSQSDASHIDKKAVTELYQHMKEPGRSLSNAAELTSLCMDISASSSNFIEVLYVGKLKVWQNHVLTSFVDDALEKFRLYELAKARPQEEEISINKEEANPQLKPIKDEDHNRTMVLQLDRTDLRLISPDRKGVLLHTQLKEITNCLQALTKSEYFGFVCKENGSDNSFIGFIFKCESGAIASDAVASISQAYLNPSNPSNSLISSCDHCPMAWYNKLSTEIENLTDKKIHSVILKRLEQLDPEDQMTILNKFRGVDADNVKEQNKYLMILLRAHCESKQDRHIHDTAENRSEFLNQYLGVGGNVFSKAKKSISNSFDQFLKRRSSTQLSLIGKKESSPNLSVTESDKDLESGSRSPTVERQLSDGHLIVENGQPMDKSLMMDIFLKVGHSKAQEDEAVQFSTGSWRQAIFKTVVTSKKDEEETPNRQRSKEELRQLWRHAIKQAILLVRMEKENDRLKAEEEESTVKRVKLDYDEMKPTQREVMEVWELLNHIKCDKPMLLQAIRQGVPKAKRGEVWNFLAERHCQRSAPPDALKYPNYNTPYEQLLMQLTAHQHAILIDLGRTFPGHPYYSSPLGPGQLSLFNLLKAYSLLDPEVGYCQGLSFVAGVLLLHMNEAQAFLLLRHLMFRRCMRTQYLPDMNGLQIKLYQLSRLMRDQLPDLYRHLEQREVVATLYAAPWILTIFASQFPLGFVARVFDLVFLEGLDVIFRVALALLTYHKDNILLNCDCFEDIMEYFKGQIANVDQPTLDKIMKMVYTTDIGKQLDEYKVEYHVLQEEMASIQPQLETLHRLEVENKVLVDKNQTLMTQLELRLANVQRLEKTRVLQQAQLNKSEMQCRGLDVTISLLGNFINGLIEDKVNIEIPDEVRRIVNQINVEQQNRGQNNLLKMLKEKDSLPPPDNRRMLKSLSTSRIPLPPSLEEIGRTTSLNASNKCEVGQKLEKRSHFFSNSHSSILEQQKLRNNTYFGEDDGSKSGSATSLDMPPLIGNAPPTVSIDCHPLSHCDVTFKYNGPTELKHLKINQRKSSSDIIEKATKTVENLKK